MKSANLVHDTTIRQVRHHVARAMHGIDAAITSITRNKAHVLFEAASPLSLAVFGPVLERLRQDDRIRFWFTSSDDRWQAESIFRRDSLPGRIIRPSTARRMKFDVYINTDFWNMTWLPRQARRVHLFHGVAGKYGLDAPVRIAPVVASFDRLLFPNRDRLQRYVDAGLVDPDSPTAALVGYPKVDCLVDGSLDRSEIEKSIGVDPRRPTVLYAPTWSPYSSLHESGEEAIAALTRLNINLVVKLHDRSYDTAARASGGINWREHFECLSRDGRVHLARRADASPYLFAADLLVTDHSSVGFEFTLLDRPIVLLHAPKLAEKARVNPQKVRLLERISDTVCGADGIARAVEDALANPGRLSDARRDAAKHLFYQPGTAGIRAAKCIYDLLSLPLPDLVLMTSPAAGRSPTHEFARIN